MTVLIATIFKYSLRAFVVIGSLSKKPLEKGRLPISSTAGLSGWPLLSESARVSLLTVLVGLAGRFSASEDMAANKEVTEMASL